jgi:pilus assembly protein CpaC
MHMIAYCKNSLALCRSGLIALLLLCPLSATAQQSYTLGLNSSADVEEMALPVGKSQIIQSDQPLSQVVVGNPEIANVQLLNENQFLVVGQQPGITNLAFKDTNERIIAILDLVVGYDLVAIKRKLDDILPEERGILVGSANGRVVLSGQVSSAMAQDAALAVTNTFIGESSVVNLLEVGGGQQVLLEARIAEIQRDRIRDLGFQTEIDGGSGSETAFSLITGNTVQSAFGGIAVGNTSISDSLLAGLEALETEGAAQVLAEPNIVALSGQEASFLVGGEFPVPVVQSGSISGGITIQYREFGVGLQFLPTVLSSDRINLQMTTEVSDIDNATGTSVLGTSVPGLRTRRVSTSIELGDGNSFAIAGLLQNDITSLINEFPGLASIPVLGALFRSTEFERRETELVIVITPRLVSSVDRNSIALPTDNFRPPSGYDMILQGRTEAPEPEAAAAADGNQAGAEQGLDGAQGHQF